FANGSMKYLFVLDVPHDNFTNILPVKINRKIFFNYFSICVTSSHITADRVPEMIPNCGNDVSVKSSECELCKRMTELVRANVRMYLFKERISRQELRE